MTTHNHGRRIALTLGAVAGGLLTAVFLTAAVASADDGVAWYRDAAPALAPSAGDAFLPDDSTFTPDPGGFGTEGFLLWSLTGTEAWGPGGADALYGEVASSGFGLGPLAITLDKFDAQGIPILGPLPAGDSFEADLLRLPFGLGYEMISGTGNFALFSGDIILTPFGDFAL